jgi:hypothetical protein
MFTLWENPLGSFLLIRWMIALGKADSDSDPISYLSLSQNTGTLTIYLAFPTTISQTLKPNYQNNTYSKFL